MLSHAHDHLRTTGEPKVTIHAINVKFPKIHKVLSSANLPSFVEFQLIDIAPHIFKMILKPLKFKIGVLWATIVQKQQISGDLSSP
jgi:hypothetical protein